MMRLFCVKLVLYVRVGYSGYTSLPLVMIPLPLCLPLGHDGFFYARSRGAMTYFFRRRLISTRKRVVFGLRSLKSIRYRRNVAKDLTRKLVISRKSRPRHFVAFNRLCSRRKSSHDIMKRYHIRLQRKVTY